MTKSLVVDVGGTYSRLAIMNQRHQMACEQSFINYEFESFTDILKSYFNFYRQDLADCQQCCIAVAGPVNHGSAQLTNINWHLNIDELRANLPFERIELINDFYSLGYCIPLLQDDALIALQTGKPNKNALKIIVGAGTGLGVALVKSTARKIEVFPSEGGHVDFAPTNSRQIKLLEFMLKKYQHISVEHLVSGHGIEHVFEFVCQEHGVDSNFNIDDFISDNISGQKIIQLAMEQQDKMAIEAIKLFSEIYAAFIGNVALQALPYGGIYITGGIARRILPYLQDNNFLNAYKSKGPISPILYDIPIHYISTHHASLLGAGNYIQKIAAHAGVAAEL